MPRHVLSFFALSFAWTWAFQFPVVLGIVQPALALPMFALGAVGPSLAAVVVARSRGELGRLFRSSGRVRLHWYLVAVSVPLLLLALAAAAALSLGAAPPAIWLIVPTIGIIVVPAVGEEIGWRGYAYPQLADHYGELRAAVVVGVLWALWHLPTAFLDGADLLGFVPYAIAVAGGGVWFAWLYERAGRSVYVAILAHAAINARLIALPDGPEAKAAWVVLNVALGIACGVSLANHKRSKRYSESHPRLRCTSEAEVLSLETSK